MTSLLPSSSKPEPPSDFSWPSPELYIYQILFSVMIIAIVLLNITVISAYSRMTLVLRRKIPNMLLLNQALVDLLIGMSSVLRVVCSSQKCPKEANNIMFFFLEYTTFLAIGVLLVGTLERDASVKVPFQHHIHVTRGKVIGSMVFTWAVTMLPALVHSSYLYSIKSIQVTKNYYIVSYTILLLALFVIFMILGVTYRDIQVSISRGPGQTNNREVKTQKKLNRVFLFIASAYLITIAPIIIGTIVLDAVLPNTKETHGIISTSKSAFHLIYIVSSFINPILTIVGKADYKNSIMVAIHWRESINTSTSGATCQTSNDL